MKKNIKYIAILALGFIACEPEFDNPIDEVGVYTSGEADFSNYVALGNSLTAGFADNALYISGQENSYPNILSQQFALAGGGEFTQPLMADNVGGFSNNTMAFGPRLILSVGVNGPAPVPFSGGQPTTDFTNRLTGPFNNMGVPGAKSYHLGAPGYGSVAGVAGGLANPYFARFASSDATTVITDAIAQSPTFFSLWIGNNDILSYATSGGVGLDHNVTGELNPANYGGNDITNTMTFGGIYNELISGLTAGGAKGVLLNLPNVTSLPFFTTVPYNPIPLNAQTAAGTNMAYAAYNGGIQQALAALGGLGLFTEAEATARTINFSEGQNAVVILDESLTDLGAINPAFAMLPKLRQATADDLLVLTSSSIIGTLANPADPTSVIGVGVPLEDRWVLTPDEQAAVESARASFNATIETAATDNGLAFFDIASVLDLAANGGIVYSGGVVTSDFVTGGGFSLDGVHPTPRAHALVANGVIDAIEATYGANLPSVNPASYGTVTFGE